MDREAALTRLTATYARALRLADDGADEPAIAEALGLDAASVGPLLAIGRQKLAHLMAGDDPDQDPDGPAPA